MREESGLTDVRVVGFLGRYLYDAAPTETRYTTATCTIWS